MTYIKVPRAVWRRFYADLLILTLSLSLVGASCTGKRVQVDPSKVNATLARIADEGDRLLAYNNIALGVLNEVQASPLLSAQIKEHAAALRAGLVELGNAGGPFVKLARDLKELNIQTREELARAYEPIRAALESLKPQITKLAAAIAVYLNQQGVSDIDLASIPRRVELAYTFLDGSARVLRTWF